MGIRVDENSLAAQLKIAGCEARAGAPRGGYVTVDGAMLGTTLHVTGDVTGCDRGELYAAVMELDGQMKASMSIFDETSLLSRLNRNETDSVDRHIVRNLALAERVSGLSGGRPEAAGRPRPPLPETNTTALHLAPLAGQVNVPAKVTPSSAF